ARRMLLDHEGVALAASKPPARLGRDVELALAAIDLKSHNSTRVGSLVRWRARPEGQRPPQAASSSLSRNGNVRDRRQMSASDVRPLALSQVARQLVDLALERRNLALEPTHARRKIGRRGVRGQRG